MCGNILFFILLYSYYYEEIIPLEFIKVTNHFFVTTAYYDYRIESVRILFGSTINNNDNLSITVDDAFIYSYKRIIYDECTKFDKYFDLKYGNIIFSYKDYPLSTKIKINNINVPFIYNKNRIKYFLSVCITAMYNYNAKLMLKQLIEIYLALGVNHFTIYYSSSSRSVLKILKNYTQKNIIKLIFWRRNNDSIRMRNYGQYIKTNDCLYRYLNISKYIINTDLDEIIVPLKYKTLNSFINNIYKLHPNTTLFLFSSKMFIKNETIDTEKKITKENYLHQHKTTDVNIFTVTKCCYSYKFYKKYIVHALDMIALQIHYAWSGNIKVFNVPYSLGYSRHTRRAAYFLKNSYCRKEEFDNNLSKILPYLFLKYAFYDK